MFIQKTSRLTFQGKECCSGMDCTDIERAINDMAMLPYVSRININGKINLLGDVGEMDVAIYPNSVSQKVELYIRNKKKFIAVVPILQNDTVRVSLVKNGTASDENEIGTFEMEVQIYGSRFID